MDITYSVKKTINLTETIDRSSFHVSIDVNLLGNHLEKRSFSSKRMIDNIEGNVEKSLLLSLNEHFLTEMQIKMIEVLFTHEFAHSNSQPSDTEAVCLLKYRGSNENVQ